MESPYKAAVPQTPTTVHESISGVNETFLKAKIKTLFLDMVNKFVFTLVLRSTEGVVLLRTLIHVDVTDLL